MSTNWTLAVNGYPGITRPLPLVSLVAFVSSYPSDETFNRLTFGFTGSWWLDPEFKSVRCFLHRCAGKLHTVHAYSSVMFCNILCLKYPNVHICVKPLDLLLFGSMERGWRPQKEWNKYGQIMQNNRSMDPLELLFKASWLISAWKKNPFKFVLQLLQWPIKQLQQRFRCTSCSRVVCSIWESVGCHEFWHSQLTTRCLGQHEVGWMHRCFSGQQHQGYNSLRECPMVEICLHS